MQAARQITCPQPDDQNQILTDAAGEHKALWTSVLLLHGDKAQSLWQRVTWELHSHGTAQGTKAA